MRGLRASRPACGGHLSLRKSEELHFGPTLRLHVMPELPSAVQAGLPDRILTIYSYRKITKNVLSVRGASGGVLERGRIGACGRSATRAPGSGGRRPIRD